METPGRKVEVTEWVSFKFEGTKIEVYPFLVSAFQKVRRFSLEIYKILFNNINITKVDDPQATLEV